jgi:DNA (cytosine-5)-methyltransferase 1
MRRFAIDLFCGAGGMTCGLIQAGYEVVAGVDKEERCRKTYSQNRNRNGLAPEFLNLDLFPKSDKNPDGQQQRAIARLKVLLAERGYRSEKGHLLLIAICAPCQPFTKITKIKLSTQRSFDRARDKDLLITSLKVVSALRPDALICENVEGISEKDPGGTLDVFARRLKRKGYSFCSNVIRAERFGVPQKRKRTICTGYAKEKGYPKPTIPDRDTNATMRTVEDAIGHLPSLCAGEAHHEIPNHRARALSDLNLKRISCAVPGETNRYLKNTPYGDLSLACHQRMATPSFGDTYTRVKGDDQSPTVTTKFLSVTNGRFGHFDVNQNRGLSIKEGALLQSFPDDYVFYPQDNLQFSATLIGNAVPPAVACYFGKHISKELASKL